jgi:hypothetical protein
MQCDSRCFGSILRKLWRYWVYIVVMLISSFRVEWSVNQRITDEEESPVLRFVTRKRLTNKALRHEGVWGSGCVDPHFLDLRHQLEVSDQLHTPVTLPPGKKPPVPIG